MMAIVPVIWLYGGRAALAFEAALGEVDGLAAFRTCMGSGELIGKNLFFLATIGAFTTKRFQMLELLKSGAVLRCRVGHGHYLLGCGSIY
jgi:hypothetical protein